MNRRDFVKLVAAVPFVGIPSLAFSDEPEYILTNRRKKYKQYLGLYADQSTGIAKKFSQFKFGYPAFDLALYGDYFKPKNHPLRLYPGFVFVVSTIKGQILEYQYSKTGVANLDIWLKEPLVETKITLETKFARFKPENMT